MKPEEKIGMMMGVLVLLVLGANLLIDSNVTYDDLSDITGNVIRDVTGNTIADVTGMQTKQKLNDKATDLESQASDLEERAGRLPPGDQEKATALSNDAKALSAAVKELSADVAAVLADDDKEGAKKLNEKAEKLEDQAQDIEDDIYRLEAASEGRTWFYEFDERLISAFGNLGNPTPGMVSARRYMCEDEAPMGELGTSASISDNDNMWCTGVQGSAAEWFYKWGQPDSIAMGICGAQYLGGAERAFNPASLIVGRTGTGGHSFTAWASAEFTEEFALNYTGEEGCTSPTDNEECEKFYRLYAEWSVGSGQDFEDEDLVYSLYWAKDDGTDTNDGCTINSEPFAFVKKGEMIFNGTAYPEGVEFEDHVIVPGGETIHDFTMGDVPEDIKEQMNCINVYIYMPTAASHTQFGKANPLYGNVDAYPTHDTYDAYTWETPGELEEDAKKAYEESLDADDEARQDDDSRTSRRGLSGLPAYP